CGEVSSRLADAARLAVAADAVRARDGAVIEGPQRSGGACGRRYRGASPGTRACYAAACRHRAAACSHGCSRGRSRTARSPRRCGDRRALAAADAVLVASRMAARAAAILADFVTVRSRPIVRFAVPHGLHAGFVAAHAGYV